ncbi:hypothetical protein ZEAMMB73_Zm00001d049454 [Zea mays]|uniref:Uncharacterized protein n=1 Tax=Zea mays TaxID=4577 RepID=A0A1D6PUV4_MAIZE|nr:hypothetical protein ZEAMMB73_Zm00001d049454 [Zea mays]AQK50386.1 hypothetical protein ZEAMMB73_Zm00001d049454 [Zea mays]
MAAAAAAPPIPAPNPTDDWVDGSWTVDCSCGVTFDDGEEMSVTPCESKVGKMDIGGGPEVTLIGSLEMPKDDIWLVTAILSGLIE